LLARYGALLLRGFGVASAAGFERLAAALCPELFADYGDLPRQAVAGRVYGSTPYPADRDILFHHESSQLERWPRRIMFCCLEAPARGGQTPLADGRRVWARLRPELRERFARLGLLYVRNFTGGLDVGWEEFFRTTERAEAESKMRAAGAEWEWLADGGLRMSRRGPAALAHPATGEAVFFNQMLAHHVSRLEPGVRESLLGLFGEAGLPRNVYFGDGSPVSDGEVDEVVEAYEAEAEEFAWQVGDVLLVDNMLAAHGRRAFEGGRRVLVAMGDMFEQSEARGVDAAAAEAGA
jgi:alpha-ketoglutarate-dependent taurine dioxygenase